jgi:NADP-dependent 3-hydroxy acid dehydrogenase YdfG
MATVAVENQGGIDVLCCNAGIMPASKLSDMQESEINSILDTNVKGTIFAVQACTAALSACGHGRFVSSELFFALFASPHSQNCAHKQHNRANHWVSRMVSLRCQQGNATSS